ncbi:hypothetical protein LTS72_19130 [Mycobacterium ostraviense]|nr:hypothetical protein [Mycobacterium ostraviense]UGT90424.1 hypothetical protein LTS72_19130 [Mycobacterium ostraviense]
MKLWGLAHVATDTTLLRRFAETLFDQTPDWMCVGSNSTFSEPTSPEHRR